MWRPLTAGGEERGASEALTQGPPLPGISQRAKTSLLVVKLITSDGRVKVLI